MPLQLNRLSLARGRVSPADAVRRSAVDLTNLRESASARFIYCDGVNLLTTGDHLVISVRDPGGQMVYLGENTHHYFVPVELPTELPSGEWQSLRAVGSLLSDLEAGFAVTAVALLNWHRTHTNCPRCGTPTEFTNGGWQRVCPKDQSEHFPRTDPAVIVAVRNEQDEILLARQTIWPEGQFSVLAGFVEPGESAEDAVRREVFEESGISLAEVHYLGSQPWPFPASLMLAFESVGSGDIRVDGEEIAQGDWYSRSALAAACSAGLMRLPSEVSIAHRMIEAWYGEPLPADWIRR